MRTLTVLSLVAAGLSAICADARLAKLALVHRHGARSGSSIIDGQVICEAPYCQLTDRGIDQLKAVGRYVKSTYAADLGLPSAYNVSYITSVSTQVPRVVVSAESMITGMYEGQEPLPFIQFGLDTSDTMMSQWNSVPAYIISNRYGVASDYINPIAFATVPLSNLTYIANFLGMYDTCITRKNAYTCIAIIYDNYNCNYTAGEPVDPVLTELLPIYKPVVAQFVNYMLGYQPTNDAWSEQVGSLGYQWGADMVSFFKASLDANDATVMKHYAAHDWSITTLYGAVGHVTEANKADPSTVPMFAQVVAMELHADDVTGALTVVPKIGYPSNTPTGPVDFSLGAMAILCMNSQGVAYDGTAGCPIDDFSRYIESTAPTSSLGQCYYTKAMLEAADCLGTDAPAMGSSCLFFRQTCPQVPCGLIDGSLADPRQGYACSSLQEAHDPSYFAATVVALVAPSLLAGAIAGFFGAGTFRKCLYKNKDSSEERQPMNA